MFSTACFVRICFNTLSQSGLHISAGNTKSEVLAHCHLQITWAYSNDYMRV